MKDIKKALSVLGWLSNKILLPIMVTILAAIILYFWIINREKPKLSYCFSVASIIKQCIEYGDSLRCEACIRDIVNENIILLTGYKAKKDEISAIPGTKEDVIMLLLDNDGRKPTEDIQMHYIINPLDSFSVTSTPNISINYRLTKSPIGEPLLIISIPTLPAQSEAMIMVSAVYDSTSSKKHNLFSGPIIKIGRVSSKETGEIKPSSMVLSAKEALVKVFGYFGTNAIVTNMPLRVLKPGIKIQLYCVEDKIGVFSQDSSNLPK